jgi:hypothetical protein
MISRPAMEAPAHVVLRAACLLAVLVGIFGMHGLANHGVSGMEAMPRTFIAPAYDTTGSAAAASSELGSVRVSADSAADGHAAVAGNTDLGGMDMSMAGLCLAVLIIGLGAVSLWLRAHRPVRPAWVLSRLIGTIERAGRDPDPPSLGHLSIRRC